MRYRNRRAHIHERYATTIVRTMTSSTFILGFTIGALLVLLLAGCANPPPTSEADDAYWQEQRRQMHRDIMRSTGRDPDAPQVHVYHHY